VIVEHEFVTTLPMLDAMNAARAFLADGHFEESGIENPLDTSMPNRLKMRRGESKAARAKSVSALPQQMIIEYDRGLVRVAAMITASRIWGGGSGISLAGESVAESPKKMVLHQRLLVALANGLERLLATGASKEVARAEWAAVEMEIYSAARQRRRRTIILSTILIVFLLGIVTLIIIAAMNA